MKKEDEDVFLDISVESDTNYQADLITDQILQDLVKTEVSKVLNFQNENS